jgi:hypothetical protein
MSQQCKKYCKRFKFHSKSISLFQSENKGNCHDKKDHHRDYRELKYIIARFTKMNKLFTSV